MREFDTGLPEVDAFVHDITNDTSSPSPWDPNPFLIPSKNPAIYSPIPGTSFKHSIEQMQQLEQDRLHKQIDLKRQNEEQEKQVQLQRRNNTVKYIEEDIIDERAQKEKEELQSNNLRSLKRNLQLGQPQTQTQHLRNKHQRKK